MEFSAYQSKLSALAARFNLMVALVFGLLLANLALSVLALILWKHHSIEITPYSGSPGYFKSQTSVDGHYLSLMSENFIHSRLNVTPETVDAHHQRLLEFVAPALYPKMLKTLIQEATLIKTQKMASHFEITHITTDPTRLQAHVSGILKRSVGLRALKDVKSTYVLRYEYTQGRLSLLSFVLEKKNHENQA